VDRVAVLYRLLNNVEIQTGSVVFVFALWVGRIRAWRSWPLPHPVDREWLTSGYSGGNFEICLTPLLYLRCRLIRNTVWELLLALDRQSSGIDLMASTVVEVLRGEQLAATVPTAAIFGPLQDIDNLLVILWLCCAID